MHYFARTNPGGPYRLAEDLAITITESATALDRPAWARAMQQGINLFRRGLVDAFLFGRVDREARNPFASVPILRLAIDAGVPMYYAQDGLLFCPSDPESLKQYTARLHESAAYIATLVRTSRGGRISRAADDGKLPTNTALFGFRIVDGHRVMDLAEAAAVRQAVQVTLQTGNPGAAARWLNAQGWRTKRGNPFTRTTLAGKGGLFLNPALIGETTIHFKGETVVIKHEAILDRGTFQALQELLKDRRMRERRTEVYYASGLGDCECGDRIQPHKTGIYRYYHCQGHCGARMWPKDRLELTLALGLWGWAKRRKDRAEQIRLAQESAGTLRRRLLRLKQDHDQVMAQWAKLLELDLEDYPRDTIGQRKRELRAKTDALEAEEARIQADLDALPDVAPEDVEKAVDWLASRWEAHILPKQSQGILSHKHGEALRESMMRLGARFTLPKGLAQPVRLQGRLPVGVGANEDPS
jgi:hypothetical protein